MDSPEFRDKLSALGLTQAEFAELIGVALRTVVSWAGGAAVPGPAEAYLNLLLSLPRPLQAQEISRISKMSNVPEGLYSFVFEGWSGMGTGFVVAQAGRVFGSDGGVSYDGVYDLADGRLTLKVTCSVPPGVSLITGRPAQPNAYSFDVTLTANPKGSSTSRVETPFGVVNVTVTYLRPLPARAA